MSTIGGSFARGGNSSAGGDAVATPTTLDTSVGCPGVFNPDQILEYTITLTETDYAALLADTSFSVSFDAQLSCEGSVPLRVAIERKRSGGASKVGLKVDLNRLDSTQSFHGLKKLGFDNGVSSGSSADEATPRDVIAEYLGWRLMQLAGVTSSRAVLSRIRINDGAAMVYVHVEQIDKRFLKDRLGSDDGWLYKKSGGDGDGRKTHESDGQLNPHEAWFCFWQRPSCAAPASETLSAELPIRLDIPQMLRLGAVNAILSNTDGLILKDNNYYHYDSVSGMRSYLPWDLDTTMAAPLNVLQASVPGGTRAFVDVLFSHWQPLYVDILRKILTRSITQEAIDFEIDRVLRVAAASIDADPALTGTAADATAVLRAWWQARLKDLSSQLQ
jgi:spore coat protein CotH